MAGGEVVASADAREDAVDNADGCGGGGDEAADLGHDDDDGDLAEVGGLAGHVWPGEDDDLGIGGGERGVVGDEGTGGERAFDHGVAAVADLDGVAGVEGWADVVVLRRGLREGAGDIELGDGGRGGEDLGGGGGDLGADLADDRGLDLVHAVFCAEDLAFVLAQLGVA